MAVAQAMPGGVEAMVRYSTGVAAMIAALIAI